MGTGMPIGNLTSQVFANIYLNELDRYVTHSLKPLAYARYGDDFVIFMNSKEQLEELRLKVIEFLHKSLKLELHHSNDLIVKARQGIKFLGCWIYPKGRALTKRSWSRIKDRLNLANAASYRGLISQHTNKKNKRNLVGNY